MCPGNSTSEHLPPLLEARELSCVRDDRILFEGLNLELRPGEMLLIEGSNGSGKTTLLRTLCGLLAPSAGQVCWGGESISKLAEEYTSNLLYIGHKPGIKEDLTGVENLRIASILDGGDLNENAAWEALERMGLAGHEDLPTKVLSQGQKRRVALARLLVSETKLWILDEPFTALDKAAVGFLQSVIQQHVAEEGMVILTTHQEVSLTQGEVRRMHLGKRAA